VRAEALAEPKAALRGAVAVAARATGEHAC
jgi:hypothetical protein